MLEPEFEPTLFEKLQDKLYQIKTLEENTDNFLAEQKAYRDKFEHPAITIKGSLWSSILAAFFIYFFFHKNESPFHGSELVFISLFSGLFIGMSLTGLFLGMTQTLRGFTSFYRKNNQKIKEQEKVVQTITNEVKELFKDSDLQCQSLFFIDDMIEHYRKKYGQSFIDYLSTTEHCNLLKFKCQLAHSFQSKSTAQMYTLSRQFASLIDTIEESYQLFIEQQERNNSKAEKNNFPRIYDEWLNRHVMTTLKQHL